jgi:hypothetical protein
MTDKIESQPQAKESDMQIGDPLPQANRIPYNSIRAMSINFDQDSPSSITATIAVNERSAEGVVVIHGQGNGVQLTALTPEILAAIQVMTDAFAAQIGV